MEPVVFVNHVRTYYDVLVKQDEEEKASRSTDAQTQAAGVVGPRSVAARLEKFFQQPAALLAQHAAAHFSAMVERG